MWKQELATYSKPEIFAIANHPSISIFTHENKLELIYAQRWLDYFRQPWEAFALMRRTNGQTPLDGNLPEQYRFVYPPSEIENNQEEWQIQTGQMGGDSESIKVWWMQ